MKLNGQNYRSVWRDPDGAIRIFDQTKLPWTVEILRLSDTAQVAEAILRLVRASAATAASGGRVVPLHPRCARVPTDATDPFARRACLFTLGDRLDGREGNDVNFPDDAFLSSRHVQISVLDDGRFQVTDLGSKNGTYERVPSVTQLFPGDFVFLGQQLFRVEING